MMSVRVCMMKEACNDENVRVNMNVLEEDEGSM